MGEINAYSSKGWDIQGFVDDDNTLIGKKVNGLPVLGSVGSLLEISKDTDIAIAVGIAILINITIPHSWIGTAIINLRVSCSRISPEDAVCDCSGGFEIIEYAPPKVSVVI